MTESDTDLPPTHDVPSSGDPDTSSVEETGPPSTGFFASRAWERPHPERIGPYRIVEILGEGGMGVVYQAEQEEPVRRQVALKLIKRGMDTREIVARFEAERQALARMNHSSIAKVFDAGTSESGEPYFVMEYVEGAPLNEYAREEGLDLRTRVELFCQICDAVQHAHRKAIIHRDLKPSNVLVSSEGGRPVPKVIDFGVAKAIGQPLSDGALYTQDGRIVGTPEYMSPEQAGLGDLGIDTRTDVYSLGVILYELLTGLRPFDPERLRRLGLAEVLKIICHEETPRPSTRLRTAAEALRQANPTEAAAKRGLSKRLRGDLDWIVLRALEKDRERRYGSAAELGDDLRRYLRDEPVLAGPPSLAYRLRKYAKRNRARLIGVAAAAIVALGFLAWIGVRDAIEYYTSCDRCEQAILGEELGDARHYLSILKETHPGEAEVQQLERRVEALADTLADRKALEYLARGDKHTATFRDRAAERREVGRRWEAIRSRIADEEPWRPVWERGEEFAAYDRLRQLDREMPSIFNAAMLEYDRGLELAPAPLGAHRQLRRAKEDLLLAYWEQAFWGGDVEMPDAFFREQIESLGLGTYTEKISGRGRVILRTEPPGAEVSCFRLVEHEMHLVPLPLDPRAGRVVRSPFLRVDRNWRPGASPFRSGDEIRTVGGRPVEGRGDLVASLARVEENESVEVTVSRAGDELRFPWVPFPEERKADYVPIPRVVDIYDQLGVTFEGYPLDFDARCRAGTTAAGSSVEVELPKGSYLFVLRKSGFLDTRLPVSVPHDTVEGGARTVRLYREEEVPPGFAHIPAGSFQSGGDALAYEGLPGERRRVDGFFLQRQEVTFAEYLEFVNDVVGDPGSSPRIDGVGEDREKLLTRVDRLQADWSSPEMRELIEGNDVTVKVVWLIPRHSASRTFLFRFDKETDRKWKLIDKLDVEPDRPVWGVSMVAAREYAAWLTRKHEGRWTFRLPRDVEWEKAARGADGRSFTWGDYLLSSFCQSNLGFHPESSRGRTIAPVGANPIDESVYGVRDLAGSVSEATLDRAAETLRMVVVRGGNYRTNDPRDFRVTSRQRSVPENVHRHLGFRLVAELPES